MALTPRMADIVRRIHRANRPAFHSLSPQQARLAYRMGAEILDLPRAPLARVQDCTVAGRPARLYATSHERLPVLLYLHGGGFTVGGLDTHDSLCRQLALRSECAVLALDYRLAPEHRFPAAVDDAYAALRWLFESAHQLGLDPSAVAVGGDSAGATLAAVCALQARSEGLPLALQLLITPGTAAHTNSASHERYAKGFLLDTETIAWFFAHYLDPARRQDWRFAPLLADDHTGLAPAFMVLAEADPLVDEGLAYADRLRLSGVGVKVALYPGVTHEFIKMGRLLPEALTAQQAAADALKLALRT
jgi:acetyl esterase